MKLWRGTILGAWALALAALLVAGRYSLFIRAQLWPLLLASTIILVLFFASMFGRPGGSRKISGAAWVRGGILLLPLIFLASLMTGAAASGLNTFALQKRSLGLSASDALGIGAGDDSAPLLDASQVMNVGYVVRNLQRLSGKHVITEGRVFKDSTLPTGQMVIFRFVVVCCAADAMPVELLVQSPLTTSIQNDGWVRIGGTLTSQTINGNVVPVIQADKIDPIAAPVDPYLTPYQF